MVLAKQMPCSIASIAKKRRGFQKAEEEITYTTKDLLLENSQSVAFKKVFFLALLLPRSITGLCDLNAGRYTQTDLRNESPSDLIFTTNSNIGSSWSLAKYPLHTSHAMNVFVSTNSKVSETYSRTRLTTRLKNMFFISNFA